MTGPRSYRPGLLRIFALWTVLTFTTGTALSGAYSDRQDVVEFIEVLSSTHGFDRSHLTELFDNVTPQTGALKAISRPAEAKPWHEYRKIFIRPERIKGGVAFWNSHEALLNKAQESFGVDPEIIVAVIGVETLYGRRMGTFRVLDTLTTLGFDYPPRGTFFRGQLGEFLVLAREESLGVRDIKGSYAGAMGMGQFIPSSYRVYAVDFDRDGRRDLWGSHADVIGSVANYFSEHGWEQGAPVATLTEVAGSGYSALLDKGLKPSFPASDVAAHGVQVPDEVAGDTVLTLVELDLGDDREYWLGHSNFYVITRYNHSQLYAMAVYQLSQEIKAARDRNPVDG